MTEMGLPLALALVLLTGYCVPKECNLLQTGMPNPLDYIPTNAVV